ncbi:MAG: UbiA family prenyltransferase [Saprospiraceae bacterium]|nr:UbiA family prenyltransferase [Saprospiraceae bacterium]
MVLRAWFRLFRFTNLAMIWLAQGLVYGFLVRPWVGLTHLGDLGFLGLSFCTVCVAASGYLINALFDRKIDALRPDRAIIPNHFSPSRVWQFYAAITGAGMVVALWLSLRADELPSLVLYPVAVLMLFLYAMRLKCTPLIGNFLVAAFIACVIMLVPYAYRDAFDQLFDHDYPVWKMLVYRLAMLSLLALLVNWVREIAKDIEDQKDDHAEGCMSTAVYFGPHVSCVYARMIWSALLILILFGARGQTTALGWIFYLGCLLLPAIVLSLRLFGNACWKNPSSLSRDLKYFMLLGMIYWTFFG